MKTKIIGGKIAEARKKQNLSQAQLAAQLFISPQAVGKWERGESLPDIIALDRLAELLEVDLNYFSDKQIPNSLEKFDEQVSKTKFEETGPSQIENIKPNWDLSGAIWADADFSGLQNLADKFSSSNIQRCKFIQSDLPGLLFKNNNIIACDFSSSDMSRSQIRSSNLLSNQFVDCALNFAEFSSCSIKDCDFSNANLSSTIFKSCAFNGNLVLAAHFQQSTFNSCALKDITFEGQIEDCIFESCGFSNVTFQNCSLKNTFFKNNNRLKRVKFINCKSDRLTYEFLKSGKADLNGIEIAE